MLIMGILLLGFGLTGISAQKKDKSSKSKEPPSETKPAPRKPRYVQPQPQPDEYEDDYDDAEYERFKKFYEERDTAKKVAGLIDYIQNGKSLTLKTYAIGAFSQIYQDNLKAGNPGVIVEVAEKFLKIPRNTLQTLDKEAEKVNKEREKQAEKIKEGEKPAQLAISGDRTFSMLVAAAADASYKLNDKLKTVEWGEKYFAETHKPETAYILATTYRELKNEPKFLEWSKKSLELSRDNPNIVTDLSVDLFRYFAEKKENPEAIKYADRFIKSLPHTKKPAALTDEKWEIYKNANLADAYFLKAEEVFAQKKYKEAITSYEHVLKYDKTRDSALLRIGFCYWHLQNGEKAMEFFACGEKMKGPTESTCRSELVKIYKSLHNGTTVGIEKVYNRAHCK